MGKKLGHGKVGQKALNFLYNNSELRILDVGFGSRKNKKIRLYSHRKSSYS